MRQAAIFVESYTPPSLDHLTTMITIVDSVRRFTLSGIVLFVVCTFTTTPVFGIDNQSLVAVASKASEAKVFNIRSFGALGDGVAMDTEAVQRTIDACYDADERQKVVLDDVEGFVDL